MSHPRNRSKIRKPFSFSQGFAQPLVSSLLGQSQVSGGLQRVVGVCVAEEAREGRFG